MLSETSDSWWAGVFVLGNTVVVAAVSTMAVLSDAAWTGVFVLANTVVVTVSALVVKRMDNNMKSRLESVDRKADEQAEVAKKADVKLTELHTLANGERGILLQSRMISAILAAKLTPDGSPDSEEHAQLAETAKREYFAHEKLMAEKAPPLVEKISDADKAEAERNPQHGMPKDGKEQR